MKRDISNLSMYAGLDVVLHNDVVDPEFVPSDSEMDNILKEIFSVDPRTGVPIGDLSYYLSPDGNPQIKAWLENNLLKPKASKVGSSIEGVTDDMIAEFARGNDESASDYAQRLRGIYEDSVKIINESKHVEDE